MAKKWKEVGGFKQATPIVINDEVDQVTEGIYDGVKEHVGENDSKVHYVKIDDELCQFWGSTVIDARLEGVQPGQEIRITYKGKGKSKTPGRKGFHDYTVEVAEDDGEEEAPVTKPVKKTAPVKGVAAEKGEEDGDLPF